MTDNIIKDIIDNGAIFVIDPLLIPIDVDDFLDKYGHMLNSIGLVAKGGDGFAYYPSNNAPQHSEKGVYFHSFCTIADNMGIKVDAFHNIHYDTFLAQNAEFRTYNSEGSLLEMFACPTSPYLGQYSAAIAGEIINYPINKIVLDNLMFPNAKACFCDRCRRTFAQKWSVERDFSFTFLNERGFYKRWVDYRANIINQTLRDITDTAKAIKNVDVGITIKTDKELGYISGALTNFGQDITNIMKITNNITFHINPWTPLPNISEDNFKELISSLAVLKEYASSGLRPSLFFWNVKKKEELDTIIKIRDDINPESVYIQNEVPLNYTKLRQINLGY